ncbi:multidrug resistance-associated protein 4-like [Stylophora pistillata]|uniref:multidrug resistance-associated protein 4-like n=1 Tax=Stylophora pistillata TaxID=50429 RepID=UPI000C04C03B|nr:multidrug resistance-associated protein 4-like [Stylophora pistillata]
MESKRIHTKANPMARSTIIGKFLTFWWMNNFFREGFKRPLDNSDIYEILPEEAAKGLADRLEKLWDEELRDAQRKNRKPRLRNAFVKFLGILYFMCGILPIMEEGLKVSAPLLIGRLLSYFQPNAAISHTDAYITAALLSLCAFSEGALHAPNFFINQRYGLHLRLATGSLIYRKALRLSHVSFTKTTTGQIVNLVTNDIQRLESVPIFFHYIWVAPLMVIVIAILCWQEIGIFILPGIFLFLLLGPLQVYIGRFFAKMRSKTAVLTDERIKTMNEIITGMRVIKMYTWEEPFAKLVAEIRRKETKMVKGTSFYRAINCAFYLSALAIISLVVFTVYVMTGHILTAEKVFVVLGLLMAVRVCFTLFFSLGVMYLKESAVSEKRLQAFLELEEREFSVSNIIENGVGSKEDVPVLKLEGITAYWDKSLNPTLKDISLEVKQGELHIVVGPVGSGKSSLLMTILGELPISEGIKKVHGRVGYASQQAWIFNGTVKENILFGQDFNEDRYQQVIECCALQKDLELFYDGDSTIVGERGLVLSGGQKARISLARAVYHDAEIYLLDDPLSAVDTHVGRELFDRCILGLLKDKFCVLVTHQLQYLKDGTSILCLQEGRCIGQGTYSDLANSGLDVQSLVSLPESDDDSIIEADDIKVKEKKEDNNTQSTALKAKNSSEIKAPEKEDRHTGTVTWKVYFDFWRAGAGFLKGMILVLLVIATQAVVMLSEWWLARWADEEERRAFEAETLTSNSTSQVMYLDKLRKQNISIYAGLVVGTFLLAYASAGAFLFIAVSASQNLHNNMFRKLLGATIYFFDTNPAGRVLNRFSKDIGQMDDMLPYTFYDYSRLMLQAFAILMLNVVFMPYLLAAAIPIVALFLFIRYYYLKTAREVKRIEAMNRSPFYSHISTSLQGLTTIRAYRAENRFKNQYDVYQDEHTAAWFLFMTGSRWLGARLDFICTVFIASAAFSPLFLAEGGVFMSAGIVGLTLTYAKMLTGGFQWCVRQSAEVENLMTSVERVIEYSRLEQETQSHDKTVSVPDSWPQYGIITFEGFYYRHHHTMPHVLKRLNLCIRAQEKVGIVGRTGAGKSSLMAALFRLAEPEGTIRIDAVPITDVSLRDLRSSLSIIPQDPILFSGSLRKNLDPFNQYNDTEVWNALEEVQLKETVTELPDGLDTKLTEGGSNFSVGQRQLVCLARAVLKHNKILIIDEATANVDHNTDALIQETIRSKFQSCTVLTIAHRLNTIMDSDRVMVLDEGKLVEFDEPYLLLQKEDTLFSQMVEHTSKHLATNLYEVARQSFFLRHELSNDDDLLDMLPRANDECPLQELNSDDCGTPSPTLRSSSSLEKEKLLYETTV